MTPRGPALWRQIHREEVPWNPKHGEEQNELRLVLQQLLFLFPGDTNYHVRQNFCNIHLEATDEI